MSTNSALPELPEPFAQEAIWHARDHNDMSWSQWHDKDDPLPKQWDDEPPDVVRSVFTADQMRAYARTALSSAPPNSQVSHGDVFPPFAIVPMVPTDEHLKRGVRAFQSGFNGFDNLSDWRAFWVAVVAATQEPIAASPKDQEPAAPLEPKTP